MKDKVFLDTNILIYAHDIAAGRKHDVAVSITERYGKRKQVLSVPRLFKNSMSM